jgi:dynein heavy chain
MSLTKLLEANLHKFREIIEEVSKKAEKQYAIERKLKELEDKIKELKIELTAFKKTGTHVLKGMDEVQ